MRYIAFSLLFFLSCNSIPDNAYKALELAFIYPTTTHQSNLNKLSLRANEIDVILDSLQKRFKTNNSAILLDSDSTEWTLGWHTPKMTTTNETYPLIIYLHGGIGTSRTDKGVKAYEMFDFYYSERDCFVASPSGNRNAPWWSEKGIERILQSVRFMELYFSIDPTRIYLAGVSDGGTGIFPIASLQEHPFAGFISISGCAPLLARFGIKLNLTELKKYPFYIIHAGEDRLYPLMWTQQSMLQLQKAGCTINTKWYPDEEHGFDYKERELEPIQKFLSTWKRKERKPLSKRLLTL